MAKKNKTESKKTEAQDEYLDYEGQTKFSKFWERINTSNEEKNYMVENLSMLVASGMDVYSALRSISLEIKSSGMKKAIARIMTDVDSGVPLWQALKNTGLLPGHVIALIQVGEKSGRLPENLHVISLQQQKDRVFYSKIRSAMLYPVFVMGLTVIIGLGVTWFILPRLSLVFSQLSIELPLVTKIFINIGGFVTIHGSWFIPLTGVILFGIIYLIFFFPKTKIVGQFIMYHTPGLKNLIKDVELARMGYILGTLLEAGLPILDAIDALRDVARFYKFANLYTHLKDQIEDGASFQISFENYDKIKGVVPIPIQQMIVASEQSGSLSNTLLKIGEIFEERSENATKNMAVILEPILLVLVWLGVMAVALAIILPIYSLIGGLDTSPESAGAPPANQPESQIKVTVEQPGETSVDSTTKTTDDEISEDGTKADSLITDETTDETVELNEDGEVLGQVRILDTGIGYLNVRREPSTAGEIFEQAIIGEPYGYLNEQDGWYEVQLQNNQTGWIIGEYAEKIVE